MNAVRAPAVITLVALLVGAFAFAAESSSPERTDESVTALAEWSLAGAAADLWFCEGPTRRAAGGPCATSASSSWRHPWATTERPGTTAVLLLHNPFPGNAVADLRLVGDLGRRESLDSQGIVVGSRSLVALDLGERVADSEVVSAIVDVRVGQLVSALFLAGDGVSPNAWEGVDLTPGLPGDAGRLFLAGPGLSDRDAGAEHAGPPLDASVVLLNAGGEAVELEVVPHPVSGGAFVEPFRLVLHAGRRQVVDLLGDGRLDGTGPFLLEVRSLPVRPGFDVSSAVDHAATSWRVRVDPSSSATATLVVANPSRAGIATVQLAVVAGPGSDAEADAERPLPAALELDPETLVEVPLPPGVVEVESSAPVTVLVREVGASGRTGWSGVAGAGTVVRPS